MRRPFRPGKLGNHAREERQVAFLERHVRWRINLPGGGRHHPHRFRCAVDPRLTGSRHGHSIQKRPKAIKITPSLRAPRRGFSLHQKLRLASKRDCSRGLGRVDRNFLMPPAEPGMPQDTRGACARWEYNALSHRSLAGSRQRGRLEERRGLARDRVPPYVLLKPGQITSRKSLKLGGIGSDAASDRRQGGHGVQRFRLTPRAGRRFFRRLVAQAGRQTGGGLMPARTSVTRKDRP
jgi:hypothetical protein